MTYFLFFKPNLLQICYKSIRLKADYISKKQDDLAKKLNAKISEGEAQINAQKEQALKEVYKIAEVLAVDVVEKMGLKQISSQNLKDSLKKIAND